MSHLEWLIAKAERSVGARRRAQGRSRADPALISIDWESQFERRAPVATGASYGPMVSKIENKPHEDWDVHNDRHWFPQGILYLHSERAEGVGRMGSLLAFLRATEFNVSRAEEHMENYQSNCACGCAKFNVDKRHASADSRCREILAASRAKSGIVVQEVLERARA